MATTEEKVAAIQATINQMAEGEESHEVWNHLWMIAIIIVGVALVGLSASFIPTIGVWLFISIIANVVFVGTFLYTMIHRKDS